MYKVSMMKTDELCLPFFCVISVLVCFLQRAFSSIISSITSPHHLIYTLHSALLQLEAKMSLAQNYSDASSQNNSDTETNIKHEQNQKENQKAANSHNEVRDPAKEKSKLQSSIFYSARYNDDEYEYR